MLFDLYLLDPQARHVECHQITWAEDRAAALAEARELGWPVRRTRVSRLRRG